MLKTAKTENSAKVVDGKLILSLPGAQTPVVWQMDLDQAKSSALEVLDKGEASTLSLKTLSGKITEIASFAARDQAVNALMDASKALENAHGQIRSGEIAAAGTYTAPKKKNAFKKWGIGILVLLALWLSFPLLLGAIQPQLLNAPSTAITSSAAPANNDARQSQGVPVSADDFLR